MHVVAWSVIESYRYVSMKVCKLSLQLKSALDMQTYIFSTFFYSVVHTQIKELILSLGKELI